MPLGHEVWQYSQRVFDKHSLGAITHFNEPVTACHYDDAMSRWTVQTDKATYRCDLLLSATGILREPSKPEYSGMDIFRGSMFHTAEWDHSVDLKDKHIGYIGTGSTASQAVPELIALPGTHVTVFQRTAQWILPVPNRTFTEAQKRWHRKYPRLARLERKFQLWTTAQGTAAVSGDGWSARLKHWALSTAAQKNLERSIEDPVLKAKLTPTYKFGCKRMIINDTFYDAIQKPNAYLETSPITRFTENGIVTADGRRHEVDVVVLSTGFDPRAFMRPMAFTGRAGRNIADVWARKVQAYRSVLIPGFPNFFLMLGPHTPIGNFSITSVSESQIAYVLQLIAQWQNGTLDTIEATPEAMEQWNAALKSRMGHTVWASGCKSWYLDADGEPLTWPDNWAHWLKAMAKPNLDDFVRA